MSVQPKYPTSDSESKMLRSENEQLTKDFDKEALLLKSLYNQWTELNARMLAKGREATTGC